MSTSKYIDKICIAVLCITIVLTALFMCGEKLGITVIKSDENEEESAVFTKNDLNADWDTSGATEIKLNGSSAEIVGNGAYLSGDEINIVYAGNYLLSGSFNGSVKIDADGDDKIHLLFKNVNITANDNAALYIKQADKVFVTLSEGSENSLTYAQNGSDETIDGAVFSRDDLTFNGSGSLTVKSDYKHGIVCNDTLVFTGGDINITAKQDAVHAHDAVNICNTSLKISAGDDAIHAADDEKISAFYLESGDISITECYEGIEANNVTIAGGTVNIVSSDDGINANGSGESSVININGGTVNITNPNGRDADGLDSNGSIYITGGRLFISLTGNGTNSAIDYGSENGGECVISGGTVIAAGSSGMAEGFSEDSPQGFIMQTVTAAANSTVTLTSADGKNIINEVIPYEFTSVLLSAPDLKKGDTVSLSLNGSVTEITVDNTASAGQGGRPGDNMPRGNNGDNAQSGNTPPQMPDGDRQNGNTPPQMPNGDKQNGNTPPQMPNGDKQNGNMPPQMPDGDRQNGNAPPQMPDDNGGQGGKMPFEQGENAEGTVPQKPEENENGTQQELPDGQPERKDEAQKENPSSNAQKSSDSVLDTVLPVLLSALVLIIGIIFVIKKKI